MKKYLCSMGAWVALAAITASGQTSSSGESQNTSGSTQGTTSSSQGATPGSQGTSSSQGNLPPGLQNRNELPPGLQNRDQLPPGLVKRTNSTSNFGATNQFGNTSQGGAVAGTNSSGLFPVLLPSEIGSPQQTQMRGFICATIPSRRGKGPGPLTRRQAVRRSIQFRLPPTFPRWRALQPIRLVRS